ncbi:hypothetical protein D0869_13997 [Hortaea werneckii]|uniref:GPI anchored protein n=1 Tax=Hortaea werneckii TaxID=91943 RepID=A0A3M6XMA1_HORWE|nr:hypothetical protein KC324_g11421 [Hortaea werneckii]KAI7564553.1 hypothetical protein KC316_g12599 [Hortaea werneckii]RMX73048.1 hypothetical protein D0869_13997 [Hortaea werneckii]RMX91914.1 hypothetical protein D0868_13710 [Hortaea werneckii]
MLGIFTAIVSLASAAVAQQTSYEPGTGVRSLWFPYVTLPGTPVASILGRATGTDNITSYVVACPTATPDCTISPNMTLTEGPSTARYLSSNDAGTATIRCDITSFTTGECHQEYIKNGIIDRTSQSVGTDVITYQAVQITATAMNSSTIPQTVTVTPTPSSTTSSSSSSTNFADVQTANGPWAMGGAVGMGLAALAAL